MGASRPQIVAARRRGSVRDVVHRSRYAKFCREQVCHTTCTRTAAEGNVRPEVQTRYEPCAASSAWLTNDLHLCVTRAPSPHRLEQPRRLAPIREKSKQRRQLYLRSEGRRHPRAAGSHATLHGTRRTQEYAESVIMVLIATSQHQSAMTT